MKFLGRLAAAAALGAAALTPPAISQQAGVDVDVELVLAVDTSQSMNADELALQRGGYVQAFRAADVARAITSGPDGRIAVTYMEWGADFQQTVLIPWTVIDSRAAAVAFADRLENAPISGLSRTSISAALYDAAALVDRTSLRAYRRVIDVSGDGPNNDGPGVEKARDEVVARGFTINGLPILIRRMNQAYDIDHLDRYYRQCVIGGPGAFLTPVYDLKHLASAVRKKLVLEIAGIDIHLPGASPAQFAEGFFRPLPGASLFRAQLKMPTEKMDCMIGEKRRAQGAGGG